MKFTRRQCQEPYTRKREGAKTRGEYVGVHYVITELLNRINKISFWYILSCENLIPGRSRWSKAWVCGRPFSGIAGFNPTGGHGCLSVVSVVCCQVEVSTTGWSRVRRSPAECVCVVECDQMRQSLRLIWYDTMYLLTAIALSPGGSSTEHIYTQTIHGTTQIKQKLTNNN
jgi:hypothetical protein